MDQARTAEADSFAQRAFTPGQHQTRESPNGEQTIRQIVAREMSFVGRYRQAGADYMNIHWYVADGPAFAEATQALEQITGLEAVTNELGQSGEDPDVVTGLLTQVHALEMPIAVWFSSDIGSASGLVNDDGSLRPNGEAFASFVHSHFG